MLSRLPAVIERRDFPRHKSHFQEEIALEQLPRLKAYEQENSAAGKVQVSVDMSVNSAGQPMIEGSASTQLYLLCQRCLTQYAQPIDKQFRFCLIGQESEAVMDDTIEPLLVRSDESIPLLELIEDELIFELPMIAAHADINQCDQTMIARATEYVAEEKQNPFAVLKNMKLPE